MITQKTKPKVSVCVVAFNQKDYIRDCLDSLIKQDAKFQFEIIVGDDASIDGTAEIIAEYASKYPELIMPVLHDKNIGAIANIVSVYKRARGEYISHIDGDDYASPEKLRKQVEVLDLNKNCALCTHDIITVDRFSVELKRIKKFKYSEIKNKDYLVRNLPFFAHSSKMFRNDLNLAYYNSLPADTVDFEIHLRQLNNGNIFHIAEFLGYYRVGLGIATMNKKINPILPAATRRVFENLLFGNTSFGIEKDLRKIYSYSILRYAIGSFMLGDIINGKIYSEESLNIKIISVKQVLVILFFRLPMSARFCIFRIYKLIS